MVESVGSGTAAASGATAHDDGQQACPEWPTEVPTAVELQRFAAGRGLWCAARNLELASGNVYAHMAGVAELIGLFDLAHMLRVVIPMDSKIADEAAAAVWSAADAGDSYSEELWAWCVELGLDADAIHAEGKAAGTAHAARGDQP